MKNRHPKFYLLTIATLILVSIDTPVQDKIIYLFSDDSRLTFHYQNNNHADTTITLINMGYYPMDTIREWTRKILEFKPKVVAVDNFSDTLYNIDKIEGTIILPIISEDEEYFEFSTNNITTRQTHGVALVDNYFRLKKFFATDSEKLPSFAIQIIKEYNSDKYEDIIKTKNHELINYLPTKSFQIIELDMYPDELLEPWIKNKIVIFGYLGYSFSHTPDIFDNNDSHLTPVGKMFGPVIIANQVQTLLENRIDELAKPQIISISLTFLLLSHFLIQKIKSNKRLVIIVALNLTLVLLLSLILFTSVLLLEKHDFFISIELIALSLTFGFQTGIVTKLIDV